MNHEHDQSHTDSMSKGLTHSAPNPAEPGQFSRSALLHKPDHAVTSGLVHANGVADGAAHAVAAASSSSGSPLPDTLMRKFENSLGVDLSNVRVHTGADSALAADAVGAKAYTMGSDIHFGAGHYDPSSSGGQQLLAHEVAHTVQQSGVTQRMQCKLKVSLPGDSLEHEADRAAHAMVSGRGFRVGVDIGVHRSIMRDGDEVQPGTTEEPATEHTGDGTGPGQPNTVETVWTIDYDRVYLGRRLSGRSGPGERTETTGIHVREFTVQPERDPVAPDQPFFGYHLRNAGNVRMGTRQHPRGQGGEASASIAYVHDPAIRIRASGSTTAYRLFGGSQAIVERVRGALARSTEFIPDDASAMATGLLSDAERAAGISIVANHSTRQERAQNTLPLYYPAISEACTMNVMIEVPTGVRHVFAETTTGAENETTRGHSEGQTEGQVEESAISSGTQFDLVQEVERNYQTEVRTIARELTEYILSSNASLDRSLDIGGQATADLVGNLSTEISVGDIIAMLEPEVAEFVTGVGPSITAAITPSLQLQVHATRRTSQRFEASAQRRSLAESSLESTLTTAMMNRWQSTFRTTLNSTTLRRRSTEGTHGDTTGTRTVTRTSSLERSDGDGVSQLDIPRLTLRTP
jgi:hypothetical protein